MRGKPAKEVAGKPPKTTASPGTIKKYMTPEGKGQNTQPEDQPVVRPKQNTEGTKKIKNQKHIGVSGEESLQVSRESSITIEAGDMNREDEFNEKDYPPSKSEMREMFASLERSIKAEMATLHVDFGHILGRVEEIEEKVESQGKELKNLKEQMRKMKMEQRNMLYKIEDQENRNRRKNLRIRGLPEKGPTEKLEETLEKLFNPLLGKATTDKIEFERIHRLRKPTNLPKEKTRDVIARFHKYETRAQIWEKMRSRPELKYDGEDIQIFPDLAKETINRKRILRPMVEILKKKDIQYFWNFPAGLGVRRDGRTVLLRYPEETKDFCEAVKIPLIDIPGWTDQECPEEEVDEGELNQWKQKKKMKTKG